MKYRIFAAYPYDLYMRFDPSSKSHMDRKLEKIMGKEYVKCGANKNKNYRWIRWEVKNKKIAHELFEKIDAMRGMLYVDIAFPTWGVTRYHDKKNFLSWNSEDRK